MMRWHLLGQVQVPLVSHLSRLGLTASCQWRGTGMHAWVSGMQWGSHLHGLTISGLSIRQYWGLLSSSGSQYQVLYVLLKLLNKVHRIPKRWQPCVPDVCASVHVYWSNGTTLGNILQVPERSGLNWTVLQHDSKRHELPPCLVAMCACAWNVYNIHHFAFHLLISCTRLMHTCTCRCYD